MVTGDPAILLHELMVCKAMVGKTTVLLNFVWLNPGARQFPEFGVERTGGQD
jgi:hypothetical protein